MSHRAQLAASLENAASAVLLRLAGGQGVDGKLLEAQWPVTPGAPRTYSFAFDTSNFL